MENDHSDSGSTQILGDWEFILPPVKDTRVSDKDTCGASSSTARRGRMLPPRDDPSYQWGGGKWKEDGRKKKKKKDCDLSRKKKKESDLIREKKKESDLSREKKKESELIREKKKKKKKKESSGLEEGDLMNEYNYLPPQIAQWYWCIEYVAKFHKKLPYLLDLMDMGYPSTNNYGSRINDVMSLRILEFLFDPTKTHASILGPRIEFDFSLSTTHVLNTVLELIPLSELRPGIPELSKFNLLPFLAHKNMSLPQCALEKLMCARENPSTSAAPPVEPNDTACRDDQPEQRDVCEEMAADEQQSHTDVLEQTSINDKDKVVDIDDDDDGVQTTEVIVIDDDDDDDYDDGIQTTEVLVIDDDDDNVMQTTEVVVIDGNDTSADDEGNTTGETSSPSLDVGVKCTKDGAWLIEDASDDDELKSPAGSSQKNAKVQPPRQENVCWKCEREGGASLLICSRSDCAAKIHKECLNCAVQYDEDGNFYCPLCLYDRVNKEYHEIEKLKSCAKRKLMKFLPLLSRASKRLR